MKKTPDRLWERLRSLIAEECEAGTRITRNASMTKGLGLDSVALASLIEKVEEEFGVEIDGEAIEADVLRTPGRLLRFVRAQGPR